MNLQRTTNMTTEEFKHLEGTLRDIANIAGKANQIFGFIKYLVWSVVGLGGIIIGSGVWVYATNVTLRQHTETIATMQAEAKVSTKEFNEWRRAKDEIDIRLTDAIIDVKNALKLHMRYTDPKGPPIDFEAVRGGAGTLSSASEPAQPGDPPAK